MAYTKFSYGDQAFPRPVFRAALYIIYIVAPAFVGLTISMLTGESGIALTGIGFLLGAIFLLLSYFFNLRKNFEQARVDFSSRGYGADFSLPPHLLIDSKRRKFAFVDVRARTYEVYDFEDILEWEHHWEDQIRSNENLIDGRTVNSKLVHVKNVLIFKINDPQRPIRRIGISKHETAQTWMARIGALLG